eukprot:g34692.t1
MSSKDQGCSPTCIVAPGVDVEPHVPHFHYFPGLRVHRPLKASGSSRGEGLRIIPFASQNMVIARDKPNMIWRVLKALYGSPQAGRRWYNHISSFLHDTFPPAVAYDEGSLPWIILLRTDDMLAFCMKEKQYGELIRQLQAARFRFTDKGEVELFCGVQFKRIEASTTQSRP